MQYVINGITYHYDLYILANIMACNLLTTIRDFRTKFRQVILIKQTTHASLYCATPTASKTVPQTVYHDTTPQYHTNIQQPKQNTGKYNKNIHVQTAERETGANDMEASYITQAHVTWRRDPLKLPPRPRCHRPKSPALRISWNA